MLRGYGGPQVIRFHHLYFAPVVEQPIHKLRRDGDGKAKEHAVVRLLFYLLATVPELLGHLASGIRRKVKFDFL